jgi:hypothetical protein
VEILGVLIGFLVLILGRHLFWLFVAAAGFFVGISFANNIFEGGAPWLILLIGVIAGLVGALLAVVLQGAAVAIAGFIVGGYGATLLLNTLDVAAGELATVIFIVGGIVGAVLVLTLFDVALILLSSLAGATMIVQATSFPSPWPIILFFLLLILGIGVQYTLMRRYPDTTRRIRRVRRPARDD